MNTEDFVLGAKVRFSLEYKRVLCSKARNLKHPSKYNRDTLLTFGCREGAIIGFRKSAPELEEILDVGRVYDGMVRDSAMVDWSGKKQLPYYNPCSWPNFDQMINAYFAWHLTLVPSK